MLTIPVTPETEHLRLLGRMDRTSLPLALDWTGSGLEIHFQGTSLWAELEAPASSPIFWMIVLADGCPVTRFPVEPGCRFYPLLLGMEAEQHRVVTLIKETQCMPASPDATVLVRSLRMDGHLLPLAPYACRIEFIGDSLTSGEGSLAPHNNQEWITPWFSATANYSFIACRDLNAERRVLSQSGYGVCWDWQHDPAGNMTEPYERVVGVLHGPSAEQRGCQKLHDFSQWQPDLVCVRLLSNDANGIKSQSSLEADRETVIRGCMRLVQLIRKNNPSAGIVWILPGTDAFPELGAEAMLRLRNQGMDHLYTFTLPDYTEPDFGARAHPNARWNEKAGHLLADYLRTLL